MAPGGLPSHFGAPYHWPMSSYEIVTTRDRPDLHAQFDEAFRGLWPEFIFHDPVSNELFPRVATQFPDYDVTVVHEGVVVAGAWGVTLGWDASIDDLPGGYDDALVRAFAGLGRVHDTLVVMAAAVRQGYQGRGLAALVLEELRTRALRSGLARVIVPVRPTLKARYPLTSMAEFARWRREDGSHLDPWIRVHERLGATILGPAEKSMIVSGTVEEWERWSAMRFPASGAYVVPEALDLVVVDRERDIGIYIEPNLWMRHH